MQIDGKTKVTGLLGWPVAHTLSPVIHNTLNQMLGENMIYVPFPVEADCVQAGVFGAYALGMQGLNVTVPHKQRVMESLAEIDPVAKTIGAVNTLVRGQDGFKGYNTDMEGLRLAVRAEQIALQGKTVVVLGAGGASKAVVYMCLSEGAARVYLLNRTKEKACAIARDMQAVFGDRVMPMALEDYPDIQENDLYVFQATSIGLSPQTEDVVIADKSFYQKICVGFDLIYNPAKTRFMQLVEQAGGLAYNGLKMLLYQGVLAYSYWTERSMEQLAPLCEQVYQKLCAHVYRQDTAVLVGFMGAGKSTVGRQLSQMLDAEFIDTDAWIEQHAGMEIAEIFARYGEAHFRRLETEAIRSLQALPGKKVIATGGGMPLLAENAALLGELGRVIYLDVSVEEVYNRLKDDTTRPLLQGEEPQQRMMELYKKRQPVYQSVAEYCVTVDGRTPVRIAGDIRQWMDTHHNA